MNKTGYPDPELVSYITKKYPFKNVFQNVILLDNYPKQFLPIIIFLGKTFLKLIKKIIADYPDWKYYHMPSNAWREIVLYKQEII